MIAILSNPVFSCVVGILSLIISSILGGVSLWVSLQSLKKINSVETAVAETKRRMTLQRIITENRQTLFTAHTSISRVTVPEDFINLMDSIWPVLTRIADIDPRYRKIADIYTQYTNWYYSKSSEELQPLKMEVISILSRLLNDIDQEG